jgi:nitrogen regulatory protein P-II 2
LKFIIAIIKPHKLDDLRDALQAEGVHGMTVSEVKGYGRQGGHKEIYRGAEYAVNYVPKTKVELAVSNDLADRVIEVIRGAANSNQIGDGKVFVFELADAMRIRTGETGEAAL